MRGIGAVILTALAGYAAGRYSTRGRGNPAGEQWAKIDGYPSYEVSDRGRVRNRRTGYILKPYRGGGHHNQYARVTLYREGGERAVAYVHRLVADAFVDGQTPARNVVHHQQGTPEDKTDNRAENLEWLTKKEHAEAH